MRADRRGVSNAAAGVLRRHRDHLADTLPEPGVTWVVGPAGDDADRGEVGVHPSILEALRRSGVIRRVNDPMSGERRTRSVWQTNASAYQWLQRHAPDQHDGDELPCGCSADPPALRNPRDKDGMQCKRCGAVLDGDEVREVLD